MRALLMRVALIQRVLNRPILQVSLWQFVPFVVIAALVSAALMIRVVSQADDESPVVLERLGDGTICPYDSPSFREQSYTAFEWAEVEWRKGHHAAAIQNWTKEADVNTGWEWPLPALRRVAYRALAQGHQEEAIAGYKKVLETPISSPVNPPRPGELPGNCKHAACVTLSDIFLEQHDFRRALEYAELALDVYRFSSPWETVNGNVNACLQTRIDAIKAALAGERGVVLEPRSTLLARWHSERRGPPVANSAGGI